VPAKAKKIADATKAKMLKGDFVIFKGPIKDNTGKTVIAAGAGHAQQDPVLEQMNYLVAGVVGKT
jgi:simple sugar transport system substrate-binding protein